MARISIVAAAVLIALSLAALNWRLYQANRVEMEPAYGAFYSAWSLYLRSVVLRASGPATAPPP
ncbi:MAG: hypothetical protein ACU837_11710, partial [Gammaproteobacteria bacterium]